MNQFLSGAIMMGAAAAALFFLKFWKTTQDRFFAYFALAFAMLSMERWILIPGPVENEPRTWVYLIRLVAFALIIYAVIDKNRKNNGPG